MIEGDMGATQTAAPRREPLRRSPANGLVAGVCAGIGRHLRIDPLIVRIVFVAAATAGGVGILLYAVAWVLVPVDDSAAAGTSAWARRLPRGRGAIEVAIGMGLVTLAFLLTMRALGIWFSDVIVWPVVLLVAGAGLLWRHSLRPAAVAGARTAAGTRGGAPRAHRAALAQRRGRDAGDRGRHRLPRPRRTL